MRSRFAVSLSAGSIAIVSFMALGAACAGPNREVPASPPATESTDAPEATESAEAATPQTGTPPTEAAVQPPVESAPAQEQAPTPSETTPAAPVASETSAETPDAKAAETETDPVKAVLGGEERRKEHEQTLARLAAERDAAAEAVAQCEKDALACKNAFMPRPKLAAESAEKVKDLDGAARVQWADNRIAEAKAALEKAQKAYDDAKANPPN